MNRLFYLAVLGVLAACVGRSEKPPPGIMSKEKMVEFLIDLQLTDSKINSLRIPDDTVWKFYDQVREGIYRKHNIDDSTFLKSMSYYIYTVKQMEEIYNAVVDSLSLRERLHKTN
jgi:hypothetical protein